MFLRRSRRSARVYDRIIFFTTFRTVKKKKKIIIKRLFFPSFEYGLKFGRARACRPYHRYCQWYPFEYFRIRRTRTRSVPKIFIRKTTSSRAGKRTNGKRDEISGVGTRVSMVHRRHNNIRNRSYRASKQRSSRGEVSPVIGLRTGFQLNITFER